MLRPRPHLVLRTYSDLLLRALKAFENVLLLVTMLLYLRRFFCEFHSKNRGLIAKQKLAACTSK